LARFPVWFIILVKSATTQPRITVITLGVGDLERAVRFYA
jgi:hypothetical protein